MPGNRMKTTIEQKIITAIVIAVSLILGALGTYTYLTAKSRLLDQAHQAIEATVGRLSTSLISPLWDLNNTGAQEFVTAEMRSREIVDLTEVPKDTLPTSMRDVTKDGEKIGSIELHFTDEFVEKELRGMLGSTLSLVVLIDLVIVAILVVLIRRVVSRPLGEVVVRLKEISEGDGDLTVSLPEEGAREISLLAESFNTFVAKTRAVIDQVKGLNLEMASAAEQLSATPRDISKSNDAVSDQSKALATAAEEMSVTVMQVERDSTAVQQVSETAQQTASNGVHVITQSVNAMQDISNVVQRAVTTVQGLGDESKNIRMFVVVFVFFAFLFFLLALFVVFV